MTPGNEKRANLDTLRTLAVLCVLIDHVSLTLNTLYLHSPLLQQSAMRLGRLGVVAFFVHTSLVLMFSLERLHRESPHPAIAFYLRRAFRIYPLAIAVVFIAALCRIPSLPLASVMPGQYSFANVLSNLLLVQNFFGASVIGPLWSLPFEVQMYLVLPAVYRLGNAGEIRKLVGLMACFGLAGAIWQMAAGTLHLLLFVPCFLSGVMAYALRTRLHARFRGVWWVALLLVVLTAGTAAAVVWWRAQVYIGWLVSVVLGCSICLFHESSSEAWNLLAGTVAKYSYGIYLLHVPSLWFVFDVLGITGPVLGTTVALLLTGAAAMAAFHAVEEPMIRYGKRRARELVNGSGVVSVPRPFRRSPADAGG